MLPDPRVFPSTDAADGEARAWHALAEASLGAETGIVADARDAELAARIGARFDACDGASIARALAASPSAAIHRHLWRAIVKHVERPHEAAVGPVLFALPVVVVVAAEGDGERALDAVIEDPGALAAILLEHGAPGGNRQFALSGALCSADAIDIASLPALMRAAAAPARGAAFAPLDLAPAPIAATPGGERVHLRFVVGCALARSPAAIAGDARVGKWGIPFTQALSRSLARPGVSVVAMPRAPQSLPAAVAMGRIAQREASAALFASNAIRRLRASVGEPVAVISAHRVPGAPAGGEVRLSLSSPFEPREAEGFRCPLQPLDRVDDVAAMLADLLTECRVGDVRMLAGVHADRDASTGLALLFKPGTVPPGVGILAH
ncbi:hypothetical protein BURK1_01345 [Burkholderiales bacterium]|nr:hypothetical protein BURK1_01345 [Burkholderiales bacterium]